MAKQADLLPLRDAQERILASFHRLESESVELQEAVGRVLAEPVIATLSIPPFHNSSMDGFAVLTEDTLSATKLAPVRLRIGQVIPAGSSSESPVVSGGCARIMTGAPLPPGADAVVPFEDVRETHGEIELHALLRRGASVRPAGQDVQSGAQVLEAGEQLGASQIALLASVGQHLVPVTRRPTVAIISTGDELISPGQPLGPGQIYNSNSPMLHAAILEAGGIPRAVESARDEPAEIVRALEASRGCDLLLTSGGASVGDFDHMKDVLGSRGQLGFWRVRIRPGKPLLFGAIDGTPLIGLPGNPTSAMVTFEQFVRPAIRAMLGAPTSRPVIQVVVDEPIDNHGGRRTFARVRLSYEGGRFHARLSGGQDSAMLVPLAYADGLLEIPEDRVEVTAGETAWVQVWRVPVASSVPG